MPNAMRHIFTILSILVLSFSQAQAITYAEMEELLDRLIFVESSGRDHVVGDRGRAKGCLQIHRSVVIDVNRYAKPKYRHNDAFNREKAKQIARLYFSKYITAYISETGREPTMMELAFLWNGGPKAMYRPKMQHYRYWNKVLNAPLAG